MGNRGGNNMDKNFENTREPGLHAWRQRSTKCTRAFHAVIRVSFSKKPRRKRILLARTSVATTASSRYYECRSDQDLWADPARWMAAISTTKPELPEDGQKTP
jgi:hypothetical protein